MRVNLLDVHIKRIRLLTNIHVFGALGFTPCIVIQYVMVHFMCLSIVGEKNEMESEEKRTIKRQQNFFGVKMWFS